MRTESHVSIARAAVRDVEIARHVAARLESGRAFAVASPLGTPRTWAASSSIALGAFESALDASRARGTDPQRARRCADAARSSLVENGARLVERDPADVAFVGVVLDAGQAQVVSAGAARAYLHRARRSQRLTPREESDGGLLRAPLVHAEVALEPGDLLMFGSLSAFSQRAIAQVVSVLEADPRTPTTVLASLLTEPAGQAGVGAAAVVLRVA